MQVCRTLDTRLTGGGKRWEGVDAAQQVENNDEGAKKNGKENASVWAR